MAASKKSDRKPTVEQQAVEKSGSKTETAKRSCRTPSAKKDNNPCAPDAFHAANDSKPAKSIGKNTEGASKKNTAQSLQIPPRSEVAVEDQWNLKKIFASDSAWRKEFNAWLSEISRFEQYRSTLACPDRLVEFLRFESEFDRRGDRLLIYAYLKSVEDLANPVYQEMKDKITVAYSKAAEVSSFVRPELLAAPKATWTAWLSNRALQLWHIRLKELLRFKPHTLGHKEERILALSSETGQVSSKAFRMLSDGDFSCGTVEDEQGEKQELTHETFPIFLHSSDRNVRKGAFDKFYSVFSEHRHSLAALLEGSVRKDIFYAKARNYSSSMEAALFSENVPQTVYKNLTEGVHNALPTLYKYYELRRKKMGLDTIHFYDTYVPILSDIKVHYTWDEAVETIAKALAPLGKPYVRQLTKGLTDGRWCDRYENIGKQSGAFSYGAFDTPPYIMINFKPNLIESVFTLAHEGGHSMHSFLSSRKQPYEYHDYVIFLAEIASTFNEQLLTEHLLSQAGNMRFRAWLVNRQIDAIRATIFRQTMFSEFEQIIHATAENGGTLGITQFRQIYRQLLEKYFGSKFTLDEDLELECLRIPHFYRSFYVYKYATGMSAAIALSRHVLQGGDAERTAYLKMLEGGCSAPPLELLRNAGVDMEKPEPVKDAMAYFAELVAQLEDLL